MRPLLLVALVSALATDRSAAQAVKYVRYSHAGRVAYGLLEGDRVRELSGDLFSSPRPTGTTARLADVKLLAPVAPSKVIAVGLNYKSHLGERPTATYPGLFAKYPTSIIATGEEIIVLCWLHEADRSVLKVHPRGDLRRPEQGVFRTRSASRPNPIGLHRVRVLGIDGGRVHVNGLEAIDGTPIVDLKPVLDSVENR